MLDGTFEKWAENGSGRRSFLSPQPFEVINGCARLQTEQLLVKTMQKGDGSTAAWGVNNVSLCMLSIIAGALVCLWAPVVQFALGLFAATLIGAAVALFCGSPVASVALWSAALVACAQVGYGLSIAALTVYQARRIMLPLQEDATTQAPMRSLQQQFRK